MYSTLSFSICHSRSAGKPTIDTLLENKAANVLLHAFDGNAKSAAPAINAKYHFSIPPSSIHSEQKKKLIEKVPIEQLLLETDSPVLGPDREVGCDSGKQQYRNIRSAMNHRI